MIYTLRTTVGRENAVMTTLANRLKNMAVDVKAVLHPGELKGYIFIEGDLHEIERSVSGIPHIRGIIRKNIKIEEIARFLETKNIVIKVNKGDIVEITGGPFKNERGKVTRVDEAKEEVTIELLEAAIPIPITVGIDSVRVYEAADSE